MCLRVIRFECDSAICRLDCLFLAAVVQLQDCEHCVCTGIVRIELERSACRVVGALSSNRARHDLIGVVAPYFDCGTRISRISVCKLWIELDRLRIESECAPERLEVELVVTFGFG